VCSQNPPLFYKTILPVISLVFSIRKRRYAIYFKIPKKQNSMWFKSILIQIDNYVNLYTSYHITEMDKEKMEVRDKAIV